MVKFPERLNAALDSLIEEALAEYRGEKKVHARTWQAKQREFKETRNEYYYGERVGRVRFYTLMG